MLYPAQRSVPVAIFTTAGWIGGTMHLSERRTLLTQLGQTADLIRLTDVTLPREKKTRPFFGLHPKETILVVPLEAREDARCREYSGETLRHEITCLLRQGVLFGSVDVLEGVRLSDYLMHHSSFIPVHRCWTPFGEAPRGLAEPIAFALLNATMLVGVAEATGEAPGLDVEQTQLEMALTE